MNEASDAVDTTSRAAQARPQPAPVRL